MTTCQVKKKSHFRHQIVSYGHYFAFLDFFDAIELLAVSAPSFPIFNARLGSSSRRSDSICDRSPRKQDITRDVKLG